MRNYALPGPRFCFEVLIHPMFYRQNAATITGVGRATSAQRLVHPRQLNHCVFALVLVLFVQACLPCAGFAQTSPQVAEKSAEEQTPLKAETTTTDILDQLRKQIESATELDEEAKKKVLETHQKAVDALGRAAKLETQAPLDQASIEGLTTRAKELQAEMILPPVAPLSGIPDDASLAELTSALATRQPQLQEAKLELTGYEAEPNRRAERRTAIVGSQATQVTRKAEIEAEVAVLAPADESPFATAARRALLLARLREVIAEGPANQAELSKYEAAKALDLPTLRIQLARKNVSRLQLEVDALSKRITTKRSQDAQYISAQLDLFAAGQPTPTPYDQSMIERPLFSGELSYNDDLKTAAETAAKAKRNVELTGLITKATNALALARKDLESLRTLKAKTNEKITRVGLTGVIGLELRDKLRTLLDPSKDLRKDQGKGVSQAPSRIPSRIRQRCVDRQEEMRDLEFDRLDLEDQKDTYSEQVEQLQHLTELSAAAEIKLRLAVDRLVTLSTLGQNYGEYFNRLGELDATEQEYVREIVDFITFIRERVLWIRSNRVPSKEDAVAVVSTVRWLASASNWREVRDAVLQDAVKHFMLYTLITILICILFMVQPRFRLALASIAEVTSRSTCREFLPTIRAAVLTIVLALPWSALAGFLSWRLLSDAMVSPFVRAVGEGLFAVTIGSLMLNLLRHLCRPCGLGLAHFEWPKNPIRLLRSKLQTLMLLVLPLAFVETTLHTHENPQGRDALERIVFVISLLIFASFQKTVLHPRTGVFRDFLAANNNTWAFRLRWILYSAAVGLPLALAAFAIAGFYYTAYELNWRLHLTIWLMIALIVLRCFLIRWFVVGHRRLRIEQARQRRQALMEEAEASPSNIPKPSSQEAAVDLQEVSEQTQRFITSGLAFVCLLVTWFIWVDVLPALGVLDRWELWQTTVDVTVEYEEDGRKMFRSEPQIESITVADALISLILMLLTFTAARNIPGLLEMTVLQRLPLEPASRYACRMVARYLIFVVGLVFASGAIGIGWAQVQWLAAALTVGLGFGLQEIFANFVSGLIILFERPVRIGDVVTIGEVSGTVNRIQIRATTIMDWDRKEYIVPNKEFVTGRLLNWTLSDKVNRVVIRVGVAYGSDTALARSLLLDVAQNHPEVLEDPSPVATFEGFGDSTLDLVLRCYLPNLDNRLGTITELHEAVDREFKDAAIEISFPQRDLHLRTVPPGFRLPPIGMQNGESGISERPAELPE